MTAAHCLTVKFRLYGSPILVQKPLHTLSNLRQTARLNDSQTNSNLMLLSGWQQDLTLTDSFVTLEPLKLEHAEQLAHASKDGDLNRLWYTSVPAPNTIEQYIDLAIAERQSNHSLPFIVYDHRQSKIIGSTRYCHTDHHNRRVEIGYTWYAKSAQRTDINTRCKALLLAHAFEIMDCIAVEFRTHWLNHPSRHAIERLGAKKDGVIRNHQVLPDGSFRDTVVYSIIQSEWPAVNNHLDHKLKIKL